MKTFYSLTACMLLFVSLHAQNCAPATAFDYLDINNVKARINNGGDMWWDLDHEARYIVPKTGNVSSLFAGALWIGGLDEQGNLHVAAQTYRQSGNDFFPGPLNESGNISAQTCTNFDRIWKVNKSTIDSFNAGLFVTPPASITQWPARSNPNLSFLPDQDLAPFIDVNGDNGYNPAVGDYPAIPGDQALWFVFNDMGNTHGETGGTALGVEVQCLAYAFKDSDACTYSTTFYHYRIINKSPNSYDSVYIGIWTDPDLGCYTDDYMGSDSMNNLGVIYNSDGIDGAGCLENYGSNPPTLAIQVLQGPTDENGTIHYLDHTMLYVNDFSQVGNPESAHDYYQFLQSIYKDGTHLINPNTNTSTNYAYPSDPSDPNGWSMCSENAVASDLRLIVSTGPFQIKSGIRQTFDAAVIWEREDVYPCPSFENIIDLSDCVKDFFTSDIVFTGGGNSAPANDKVNVFPNPVEGSSIINFSGQHIDHVEIFDVAGRKLLSVTGKNENLKVNSDQLGKGMFIYQILYKDHSHQTGKLIVQ